MATSVAIPQGPRTNLDKQSTAHTTHRRLPSTSTSSSSRSPSNPRRLAVAPSFDPSAAHLPRQSQTHALPQTYQQAGTAPPYRAAALRASLTRRRSSYPPATTPSSSARSFPDSTTTGSDLKVNPDFTFDSAQSFGPFDTPDSGMGGMGWDGLINFDSMTPQATPNKVNAVVDPTNGSSKPSSGGQAMSRARSEPGEHKDAGAVLKPGVLTTSGRFVQSATDMAWKTILGSVVEVEGVGEIGVCRVLQEIWKRGGGDMVTAQSLWSSIIMTLSLPSSSETSIRISTPSAQASTALQELYRLTLKHWEPAIFSGLLAQYNTPGTPTAAAPDIDFPSVSAPKYGASTPTREFDASFAQWTNVTPGLGGDFSALFGGSTGLTPRNSISHPSNLGQFEFHFDERPAATEPASGIDEILASMEEGQQADEREIFLAAATQTMPRDNVASARPAAKAHLQNTMSANSSSTSAFQLPTPETDSDATGHTPRSNQSERASHFSPDSMASPYVTGSSGTASAISKDLSMTTTTNTMLNAASAPVAGSSMSLNRTTSRAAHPTSLVMPTEAFVPPPPMCMFFNPSFRDLQQGKVGVWKGDLELMGTSGGTFSVLIVGEEVSGHLWQSHQWAPKLTHPPEVGPDTHTSSFTSKMIPVAYLAREGFTPVTMGMVLCNDDKIQAFVSMVQSMHSEGVAFHLPNPANLPIVFLPAKFDPHDQLQRLGIAYMTKPGAPIPGGLPKIARSRPADAPPQAEPKRKKRRQSMPAQASVSPGQSKRRAAVVDARAKHGTLTEEAEDGTG